MEILENKLYRIIGGLMKSRNIMIIVASIAVLLSMGGCTVKQKDDTKQGKTIAASSTKDLKEDEETIKKKQVAFLKHNEQAIIGFVKSKNSKIESVQIDWSDIRWGEAGNGTPQGGGKIIEIYGGFNHIEKSGWNVTIEIIDGMPDLKTMMLSNGFGIGGEVFE